MRAVGNGLIATLAVTTAVLATELESPTIVRVSSALLLVLWLPGLALMRALFPARALGGVELLLLTLALSLSLAVVGGIVLHLTPFGLTRGSWAVLLASVTVIAAVTAQTRHHPDSAGSAPRPPFSRHLLVQGALLVLALALGAHAMSTARTPLPAVGIDGYTALWLLPDGRRARFLKVGVQSSELQTTRYRLEVRAGRTRVAPYRFELPTGGRWSTSLRVERGFVGTVRAVLYRATESDRIYRRVRLLVDARHAANRR